MLLEEWPRSPELQQQRLGSKESIWNFRNYHHVLFISCGCHPSDHIFSSRGLIILDIDSRSSDICYFVPWQRWSNHRYFRRKLYR
jgi:hypothetical protein